MFDTLQPVPSSPVNCGRTIACECEKGFVKINSNLIKQLNSSNILITFIVLKLDYVTA